MIELGRPMHREATHENIHPTANEGAGDQRFEKGESGHAGNSHEDVGQKIVFGLVNRS
jgi:hypothetical protein